MQFTYQVGTDYSTVKFTAGVFDNIKFKLPVIESFEISFQRLGGEFLPETIEWKFPNHVTSEVLEEVIRNTCFVCGGLMQDSKGFAPPVVETEWGKEIWYIAPANLRQVRKCSSCGHSHT